MNLMTLVRLLVVLVLGWTVVALGVGVFGVGTNESTGATFYVPSPSLVDTFTLGRLDHPSSVQHRLIDRVTGRVEPLSLPQDKAWSLLSVSPWRDRNGFSMAVGRWISRLEGQDEFCGLGLLKLPGGTLENCLSLEVLPTGKPCWVPGQTDEILFPAGDGQLYRCNIAGNAKDDGNDGSHGTSRGDGGNLVAPRVVTWGTKRPGSGDVFLCDPAWSAEPALRNFIFVSLSEQKYVGTARMNRAFKLWSLLMNDAGDTIVAAERLTRPDSDEDTNDTLCERMPTVVVGSGGQISLVYLAREPRAQSWQLRMVKLQTDHDHSLPRIGPGSTNYSVVADGMAAFALVVSADAKLVHGIDISGAHREVAIAR
jgi:hypothetical protein